MMKDFTKHIAHYVPLMGIFMAGTVGFWLFAYDRQFQLAVSIAVTVAYVVWGVVHHIIHKDLCLEIFFEYLMFAAVGFLILASVIFS